MSAASEALATCRQRVLAVLAEGDATTREIVDEIDGHYDSVVTMLSRLKRNGTVFVAGQRTGTGGAPQKLWRMHRADAPPPEPPATPKPRVSRPCLGGCGTLIPRDGITFMCRACRRRSGDLSPLHP